MDSVMRREMNESEQLVADQRRLEREIEVGDTRRIFSSCSRHFLHSLLWDDAGDTTLLSVPSHPHSSNMVVGEDESTIRRCNIFPF